MNEKQKFLELIQSNIHEHGYHVTIVNSKTDPRYAYTIGLFEDYGFELILSGGIIFLKEDLYRIFESVVSLIRNGTKAQNLITKLDDLGSFSLQEVDGSWSDLMMLGVFDFYKIDKVVSYQIIPDKKHHTLDIPDMNKKWDSKQEPVWKWLVEKWEYSLPDHSKVITNIDALKGEVITEVMRWEEDELEMFAGAGPDVEKEEMRVVSLGTLLGIDNSLEIVNELSVGKGIWRDSTEKKWNPWGK
ncbi:DUF4262 domain-containing protein [Ekhidna sp.]